MIEIRIHGRGGQGSVVTSEMLAIAAFKAGKYSQAFPYLGGGGERRGAPVQAFCRMDSKPIELKCRVMSPDYLIVQDISLINVVDIFNGLKERGTALLNSPKSPQALGINVSAFKIYNFPATEVGLDVLGKPMMNTAMIGSFAAITGLIDMDSLTYAVERKFSGETRLLNLRVLEKAFYLATETFKGSDAGEA